jgi:hypothetical protein
MRNNCNNAYLGGGFPMAHNEQKLFMMVLIELQRALDTDFYRHSPQSANAAEPTRALIPLVVSRHQRYFVDRLQTRTDDSYGPRYYWHYMDDVPAGINTHTEDTSHGQVDMQYLDVLRRNYDRLNALASARGEPIPLDTTQVRLFANTFLERVAGGLFHKTGIFLASDIDGTPVDSPANADYYAKLCDGWLNLAAADPNVYTICREISLRIVNGWQPHVSIGNHSALLMNKAYSQ